MKTPLMNFRARSIPVYTNKGATLIGPVPIKPVGNFEEIERGHIFDGGINPYVSTHFHKNPLKNLGCDESKAVSFVRFETQTSENEYPSLLAELLLQPCRNAQQYLLGLPYRQPLALYLQPIVAAEPNPEAIIQEPHKDPAFLCFNPVWREGQLCTELSLASVGWKWDSRWFFIAEPLQ